MEMRDSPLIGGRMRMDADGTAQAQAQAAQASAHATTGAQRQAFTSAGSAGSMARTVGRAVSMMFSRGDELRPYQSCASHLKKFIPLPIICLIVCLTLGTAVVATFVQPEFENVGHGSPCVAGPGGANCTLAASANFKGDCVFGLTQSIKGVKQCPLEKLEYKASAPKWKAYFVMNVIILTIGAITMGAPIPPTILVTNVVFVLCKILTEKEAFAGFGSPGIVALAILFVIAAAVERSGLLEPLIDALMGDGSNPHMSRVRLISVVTLMSGFVSNTPVCAMIMPFAINWAQRRGLEPFDYLLPIAFAANIGGTLTQIGSPPNLVVFEKITRTHSMGMFFPTTMAGLCALAFIAYTYFLGPWLLQVSVRPKPAKQVEKSDAELYEVRWVIMSDSELVGSTWRDRGLTRMANTRLKRVYRRRGPGDVMEAPGDLTMWELSAGDEVIALSDAKDVAKLRFVRGLLLADKAGDAVRRLGANRRRRCLFEGVFRPGVDAAKIAPEASDLREAMLTTHKAALIAFRGPADAKGRLVLLEADESGFEAKADKVFALVRKVPGTTPPRTGRPADPMRAWFSMAVAGIVIGICILNSIPSLGLQKVWLSSAPLASLAIIGAALIVASDVMTLKEALNSINVQAYIGIAGSLGMGTALQKTGVARAIALSLVSMVKAMGAGPIGIAAAMFVAACMLSNVVTNTAVAVLVLPIAETIAAQEGIDIRVLGCLVILASNFALATPFACATNLMVMAPLGPNKQQYSFGDYVRYGVPLQITLILTALLSVYFLYDTTP